MDPGTTQAILDVIAKQATVSRHVPSYKEMLAAQAAANAQAAVDKARAMLSEAQPLALNTAERRPPRRAVRVGREVREQAKREQSMVDALDALVALQRAEADSAQERGRHQDERDARVLRWTIASVLVGGTVGVLGVVVACVSAF